MILFAEHLLGNETVEILRSCGGLRCSGSKELSMAGYVASKAGLIRLTQQVALDYGPSKVRCNAICPGAVRTAMFID